MTAYTCPRCYGHKPSSGTCTLCAGHGRVVWKGGSVATRIDRAAGGVLTHVEMRWLETQRDEKGGQA